MSSKTNSVVRFFVRSAPLVVALLAVVSGFAHAPSTLAASRSAAQVNREGGVEVKVTPQSLASGAPLWEFEVTFSTHSVTLTGDPAQFSVLVDARGNTHAALAWTGDPPGGHHRKGSLRFKPLAGDTAVELRINGVAGVATRAFRWERK